MDDKDYAPWWVHAHEKMPSTYEPVWILIKRSWWPHLRGHVTRIDDATVRVTYLEPQTIRRQKSWEWPIEDVAWAHGMGAGMKGV